MIPKQEPNVRSLLRNLCVGCPDLSCPPVEAAVASLDQGRAGFVAELASPWSEHQCAPWFILSGWDATCVWIQSHSWAPHMQTCNALPPRRYLRNLSPKPTSIRNTFLATKPCAPVVVWLQADAVWSCGALRTRVDVWTGPVGLLSFTKPCCPCRAIRHRPCRFPGEARQSAGQSL